MLQHVDRSALHPGSALPFILSLFIVIGCAPALSQERAPVIACMARPADTAAPPPMAPPPQKRTSDGSVVVQRPPLGQPVCPVGQIPVFSPPANSALTIQQNLPPGGRLSKGNPLLGPQSAIVPPPGQQGAAALAREFSEIYGEGARLAEKPATSPSPNCLGQINAETCYYYGSAGISRDVMGGGMTTSVDRPLYVTTKGQGHSLNEIAVQGGVKNGNIVEVGWIVSTDMNGDADPHIFVYHWINWDGQGYDGYGWVQFSNRYYPTQNISALLRRELYLGYVLYDGNWWAWFDGDWLGYFPETLWGNNFGAATTVQWFGEVATNNGVPPQIQMGDGKLPPPPTAAHMYNVCDVDVKAWTCFVRNDQQLATPAAPKFYSISQTGFGDLRYGGPGH